MSNCAFYHLKFLRVISRSISLVYARPESPIVVGGVSDFCGSGWESTNSAPSSLIITCSPVTLHKSPVFPWEEEKERIQKSKGFKEYIYIPSPLFDAGIWGRGLSYVNSTQHLPVQNNDKGHFNTYHIFIFFL